MAQMAVNLNPAPDYNYHLPVVVFDLDDTLIRERDFCRTGFDAICQELCNRYPGSDHSVLRERLDQNLTNRKSFLPVLRNYLYILTEKCEEVADKILTDILDIYGSHVYPAISPLPERIEVLETLSRRGYKLALVTDGRSVTQRAKLISSGLMRFFNPDLIFISAERGVDKSSPESFSQIVRIFPEASRFIYIGDNPEKDLTWPTLLGWDTFLVKHSEDNVHPQQDLTSLEFKPTYNSLPFRTLLNIL